MELFSLEAILCLSHVTFNKKTIFCYLNRISPNSDFCPEYRALSTVYTGLHPDGDPSGSLLKDETRPH